MKNRAVFMVISLLISLLSYGCSANKLNGKVTGFKYIVEQANEMEIKQWTKNKAPDPVIKKAKDKMQNKTDPNKKVYLTFDDGPDSTDTPIVLDILDSYGVKATFFVVGTNIEKNPELLKQLVKRGHSIGNHTYNHRYNDVYSGIDGFLQSIKTNEDIIYNMTGVRPRVVRDPGGRVRNNLELITALERQGYRLVDWNVDSYDSRKPYLTAPQIIENIRQQSLNKNLWPGMVILMHDGQGHLNSARALPTILEMLLNQGFKFEVLK